MTTRRLAAALLLAWMPPAFLRGAPPEPPGEVLPLELAFYDGEGHVPGDWSLVNAVDAAQRMLGWLEKHMPQGFSGGAP